MGCCMERTIGPKPPLSENIETKDSNEAAGTITFSKERHSSVAVFKEKDEAGDDDGNQVEIVIEPAKIAEEETADEIVIHTEINDIKRAVKEEVEIKSSEISKAAVQKLIIRKKEDKGVKISFNSEDMLKSIVDDPVE